MVLTAAQATPGKDRAVAMVQSKGERPSTRGCLVGLDALHETGLEHSHDDRSLERVHGVYSATQFPSPKQLKV